MLFKFNYTGGNNHIVMLKKIYELSLGSWFLLNFVFSGQNLWLKIEIYVIHYFRFIASEDNPFQLFRFPKLFYGQTLVLIFFYFT